MSVVGTQFMVSEDGVKRAYYPHPHAI